MITTIIHAFRELLGISLEDYVIADIIYQRQAISPWVPADTIKIVGKQLGLTPITITAGLKRLEQQRLVEYHQDTPQLRTTDLFNPLGYTHTPPQEELFPAEPVTKPREAVNSARDRSGEQVDLQKVMDYWNQLFGTAQKLTPNKRLQMRARFKTFTKAEILKALKARSTSSWHLEPANLQHRMNFGSFWRSDDKVENFLIKKDINASNPNGLRHFAADEYVA